MSLAAMGDGRRRAAARAALYGLQAILRLHTVQEDEAYLSLGDDAETVPPSIVRGLSLIHI